MLHGGLAEPRIFLSGPEVNMAAAKFNATQINSVNSNSHRDRM